jgi:hypothetical protein
LCGLSIAAYSVVWDPEAPPPPGQLIDLGDRRLHLNCSGSGSPPVVVENGAGAFSMDWALVQAEVATFGVCDEPLAVRLPSKIGSGTSALLPGFASNCNRL